MCFITPTSDTRDSGIPLNPLTGSHVRNRLAASCPTEKKEGEARRCFGDLESINTKVDQMQDLFFKKSLSRHLTNIITGEKRKREREGGRQDKREEGKKEKKEGWKV